jgi:hypothetical protein
MGLNMPLDRRAIVIKIVSMVEFKYDLIHAMPWV